MKKFTLLVAIFFFAFSLLVIGQRHGGYDTDRYRDRYRPGHGHGHGDYDDRYRPGHGSGYDRDRYPGYDRYPDDRNPYQSHGQRRCTYECVLQYCRRHCHYKCLPNKHCYDVDGRRPPSVEVTRPLSNEEISSFEYEPRKY